MKWEPWYSWDGTEMWLEEMSGHMLPYDHLICTCRWCSCMWRWADGGDDHIDIGDADVVVMLAVKTVVMVMRMDIVVVVVQSWSNPLLICLKCYNPPSYNSNKFSLKNCSNNFSLKNCKWTFFTFSNSIFVFFPAILSRIPDCGFSKWHRVISMWQSSHSTYFVCILRWLL